MNQLALPLQLADHAVFASFLAGDNETLVATLVDLSGGSAGQGCWLWGSAANGKTHLLQAIAWMTGAKCTPGGRRSLYLTAERFMYDFVNALKTQSALDFKSMVRSIDLLLIVPALGLSILVWPAVWLAGRSARRR